MQIHTQERERVGGNQQQGVSVAPNLKREREMFDRNGNVIDPKTKQIIRPAGKNE